MSHAFFTKQFLTFLLTGGTAAAVNFVSRIIFNQWVGFSAAVILAYSLGIMTAFVLAKLFVFTQSQQAVHRSALLFCLVNAVAVIQTWLISLGLAFYVFPAIGISKHAREIAHAVGVLVPVFTSYIGHKRWTFK